MLVDIFKSGFPTASPLHDLKRPAKPPTSSPSLRPSSTSSTPSAPARRLPSRQCTPTRSSASVCQPIMEATKALAQKWKRKSSSMSIRSASSLKGNKKEAKAAAEEARAQAQATRTSVSPQQSARRDSERRSSTATARLSWLKLTSSPVKAAPPPTTLEASPSSASPASDVSPGSRPPPKAANGHVDSGYFTLPQPEMATPPGGAPPNRISFSVPNKEGAGANERVRPERSESQDGSENAVSTATPSTAISPRGSMSVDEGASSTASFNDGRTRRSSSSRGRDSSPPIVSDSSFRKHVNFSNVDLGEPTKNNFPCYTQIIRHQGYAAIRRSRTFMVGIDDHQYSDEALRWLFEQFVDGGDEIVCVKVLEKEAKVFEKDVKATDAEKRMKEFHKEANVEVERIKAICGDRAVSIVLEYGVGKLHSTFQRLIQLHQPSMLIVGTRGRTLGGIQGLMTSRNSFSKYCLQYSPVPVVVVRPDSKRQKKKEKRDTDLEKQSYRQMLQSSQGIHEADIHAPSAWEIESKLSADEEAGKVARALGLPAKFDPTLKPYKFARQRSALSMSTSLGGDTEPVRLVVDSGITPTASAANSDDDVYASGDEDEGEGEFEVESGAKILQVQKKELQAQLEAQEEEKKKKARLHKMEMGEGAALSKKPTELESDDEADDDDEDGGALAQTTSRE